MCNKICIDEIKIKDIIENNKKYYLDLPYQRNGDAWSKKNASRFIDSLINNYLIPPIIVNKTDDSYDVLDGKQRITNILNFYNNKVVFNENSNKKLFRQLTDDEKDKFLNREIPFIVINETDEDKIRETFLRINKGSINLNKNEFIFANSCDENRKFIHELAKDKNFQSICDKKREDKRFSREGLIAWTLTILCTDNRKSKSSVRNLMPKLLEKKIPNFDYNDENKKFLKTFDCIKLIIDDDIFIKKSFKTIYAAIFCSFYKNIECKNCFFSNKENINNDLRKIIKDISDDQMGGGVKYDRLSNILEREDKILSILNKYCNDLKRNFNDCDKTLQLRKQNYKCAICKTSLDINNSHADHIIPYSKGGKTTTENLQILCPNCNLKKSNK